MACLISVGRGKGRAHAHPAEPASRGIVATYRYPVLGECQAVMQPLYRRAGPKTRYATADAG